MHLRSLTLKGFKSFPDRTRLEFGPGVSVIVGPNGSGKSNVTDAVLWVMGEQSPLAVRGRSMQDVIFGGGHGVQARSSAEVEVVLDNGDGAVDLPFSEISIQRRLDRSGDGEYRLNGAKCRLVDVLEVLSDTGLGKEMHSVVSQGRIEAIVTSKPRDRRLLIEEAAGLGKHRKRRRRAQLKLDRTQDNLDRALDVERESRSRLRPLKRQAEAAELHERLERQAAEIRYELAREQLRARGAELETAVAAASEARAARQELQQRIGAVAASRREAETALATRSEQRERLATRVERARSGADRIEMRRERAAALAEELSARIERGSRQLTALRQQREADGGDDDGSGDRIAALERELQRLDEDRAAALARELVELERQHESAATRVREAAATVAERREAVAAADRACEVARQARRAAETTAEHARRDAAKVGAELARANQFLRSAAGGTRTAGTRTLADELEVEAGCEVALSAALGARLSAAVVDDRGSGATLLDRSGRDGGRALVADGRGAADAGGDEAPPVPGARRLAELVRGPDATVALARALLTDCWLVEDLDAIAETFAGVAVTAAGRAWLGRTRELVQVAEGGVERVLAVRNERDALIAESERRVQAEQEALHAVEAARQVLGAADASREQADGERRAAERAHAEAEESARQAAWLIEQRRRAPEQGEAAVRRAQVEGELAAERRVAEQAERQRRERDERIATLTAELERDRALEPAAGRLGDALTAARAAVGERVGELERQLAEDRAAGEGVAARLRECAREEAELQRAAEEAGEAVTRAEVRAQQLRDAVAETTTELGEVATALGLAAEARDEPLDGAEQEALRTRLERIAKRRAQLGPVNPLAMSEYEEAVAHVEELERQREDLEAALRELREFIRDTDRQIRETFTATFTAAAANFEELAGRLFPGGRGRLTLVRELEGDRPEPSDADDAGPAGEEAAEREAEESEAAERGEAPDDDLGVEIEITPAGKSMKRLTLLSGGEKTMTAIAFLFSVFLARPCPFYILDEVEAALDDVNITRFLDLLGAYAGRAQFIVVTHQKRTMEAADTLYGVSMGQNGVSKVISRKMSREALAERESAVTPTVTP